MVPAPLRERRSNDRGDLGTAGGNSRYSPTSNLYYYSTPMGSSLSQTQCAIDESLRPIASPDSGASIRN